MADDELRSLLYVSTAEVPFTSTDLVELVSNSAYANEGRGITGYLWFDGSMFLQYLEGPPAEVAALEAKIFADERHTIVKRFHRTIPATDRRFEGWNMRLMNDRERFEMLMEGILVALLELPDGDQPSPRSAFALTDQLSSIRSA